MAGVKTAVDEFKAFILRGNVLDLAVAVILGIAFGAVVNAFADGILMAFIAAIFGEPSFNDVTIGIGDGVIKIGTFITAVINFLLIAAALFVIIKIAGRFTAHKAEPEQEAPVPSDEALLLGEIRDLLRVETRGSRGRPPSPPKKAPG